MNRLRDRLRLVAIIGLASLACSGSNDNSHTTATTVVAPPPRQVLKAEARPAQQTTAQPDDPQKRVDRNEPLMIFNFPDKVTVTEGAEVVIDFSLANVKLKDDGGQFRVRYIVDDDDMQWIDRWEQVVLTGWIPGKHTIRLELIGPDGWPYRNGEYNVVTRELTIVKGSG